MAFCAKIFKIIIINKVGEIVAIKKTPEEIYTKLFNVCKKHKKLHQKALDLESELGDAVLDEDDDLEYEILESRTAAWEMWKDAIKPITKALSKMSKIELAALHKVTSSHWHESCRSRSPDEFLIEELEVTVSEYAMNAPSEPKAKPKAKKSCSGPSM